MARYVRSGKKIDVKTPKIGLQAIDSKGSKPSPAAFRSAVLEQLAVWSAENPSESVIASASAAGKELTRADLHAHVKKRTKFGNELVNNWMNAAIRSVLIARK